MANSSYIDYILDLLLPLGGIKARKMFGGVGIYKDGIFFALVTGNDIVYFKVDDITRSDYEKYESKPFTYEKNKKIIALSYWEAPVDILENRDALEVWVEKAVQAARRARKS